MHEYSPFFHSVILRELPQDVIKLFAVAFVHALPWMGHPVVLFLFCPLTIVFRIYGLRFLTSLISNHSHYILCQPMSSSHEVAKVLEFQLQHHSFQRNPRADLLQNGLVGSPCNPRDSQESSPTAQFKGINSSALSFLYSLTLTSLYDYWKNHSPDQTNLY